jgi:hypothetical protein
MIPKRLLKVPRKKRKKIKNNRGKRWEGREHNGRTVAPEAILFESPCRAHPET